jgi:hypothetical protein
MCSQIRIVILTKGKMEGNLEKSCSTAFLRDLCTFNSGISVSCTDNFKCRPECVDNQRKSGV